MNDEPTKICEWCGGVIKDGHDCYDAEPTPEQISKALHEITESGMS